MKNIHAIILAAGGSSRYGSPKQLLPWNGSTLLQHVIDQAQSVCNDNVDVVLGANAESIRATLCNESVDTIINNGWREGMASSIRAGINALPDTADAVLFLLCDQPMITHTTLSTLVDHWQNSPGSIVASRYQETNGVPAIFPRVFFNTLLALKGDRGAKQIINTNPDWLVTVPVPEAGIDIDTRDDLEVLLPANETSGVHHDNAHDQR